MTGLVCALLTDPVAQVRAQVLRTTQQALGSKSAASVAGVTALLNLTELSQFLIERILVSSADSTQELKPLDAADLRLYLSLLLRVRVHLGQNSGSASVTASPALVWQRLVSLCSTSPDTVVRQSTIQLLALELRVQYDALCKGPATAAAAGAAFVAQCGVWQKLMASYGSEECPSKLRAACVTALRSSGLLEPRMCALGLVALSS